MDILEYIVRLRGAAAAAAEVRGLAGEFDKLALSEERAAGASRGMGAASSRLGGVLMRLGAGGALALAGIGLEATKMATNFNHEMLRIRTDAGASTQELANMKVAVLDLASSGKSMGEGPLALAQGLYHLESLGLHGKQAIHGLTLAAQESAISGANLEQTTSALGAAMFIGIKGAGGLDHIMGLLNATVGSGNMRMQQLIESLGTGVLGSFKVAHMSIQDVSAALAVLTDGGYHASSAAAQLSTALHFLYAPSSKAETALHNIGLSGKKLGLDLMKPQGLLVALRDLRAHMKGLSPINQEQILGSILPGGRGRVLLNLYEQIGRLRQKYGQEGAIVGGFHASVAAQRQDPQTRLKTAEAGLQARMIRLGNVLSPLVLPALTHLVDLGSKVLGWLAKAPAAIKGVVHWFDNLGGGAGKVGGAVGGFIHAALSDFHSLERTVSGVARSIGMAFSGIGRMAHHIFTGEVGKDVLTIGRFLLGLGTIVVKVVGGIFKMQLGALSGMFRGAFNIIAGIIKFIANLLTGHLGRAFSGLAQIAQGAIQLIIGSIKLITAPIRWVASQIWTLISGAFTKVLGFVKSVPASIAGFFKGLGGTISSIFDGVVNGIIAALNFIIHAINSVISSYNSVAGSIPFLGGNLTIGQLGTISPIGTTTPASAPSALPPILPKPTHAQPKGKTGGATPRGTVQRHIAIHAHFDHPIVLNGREIGRIHRKEIINAMAGNQ